MLLDPPVVIERPGGYTKVMGQIESERAQARRERDQARGELKKLQRETSRRKGEAAAADSRRSKRKVSSRDHDAKAKIDAARVSGKDGQAVAFCAPDEMDELKAIQKVMKITIPVASGRAWEAMPDPSAPAGKPGGKPGGGRRGGPRRRGGGGGGQGGHGAKPQGAKPGGQRRRSQKQTAR